MGSSGGMSLGGDEHVSGLAGVLLCTGAAPGGTWQCRLPNLSMPLAVPVSKASFLSGCFSPLLSCLL